MPKPCQSADNLIFVDPSPVARRLLWHLFSIGSRRVVQADRHERFEKPGAHLFWVQSGEGELEYKSRRFQLRRGKEVWLVDMGKPRTYIPAPGRHLTIAGFRFGGPGLEFWHEEFRDEENAEFPLEDFEFGRALAKRTAPARPPPAHRLGMAGPRRHHQPAGQAAHVAPSARFAAGRAAGARRPRAQRHFRQPAARLEGARNWPPSARSAIPACAPPSRNPARARCTSTSSARGSTRRGCCSPTSGFRSRTSPAS